MATLYGVKYDALVNDQIQGSDQIERGLKHGQVHMLTDEYEAAAAAIGDKIYLGPIPKGARILPQSQISNDALGASSTVKVGDSDDDDRYAAATSTATAGTISFNDVLYKTTEAGPLVLTVGGAAITGTLKAVILYTY